MTIGWLLNSIVGHKTPYPSPLGRGWKVLWASRVADFGELNTAVGDFQVGIRLITLEDITAMSSNCDTCAVIFKTSEEPGNSEDDVSTDVHTSELLSDDTPMTTPFRQQVSARSDVLIYKPTSGLEGIQRDPMNAAAFSAKRQL